MTGVATRCPAVAVPALTLCDPAELGALCDWLAGGASGSRTFPRGTVIEDRLDLCKQGIGPEGAAMVLAALRGSSIRSILFGTGAIGDAGAAAVADALDHGLALDTIYLGCNRIGPAGAAVLAGAVERSRASALWLKRNPLGIEGAQRIARAIAASPALRVLDLYNCELEDDGVAIIVDAIAGSQLAYVYLGGNAAGARSAAAIGALLASSTTLRGLSLLANRLGDEGAIVIAAGLARNTTLEDLGLASCAIGARGGIAVAEAATHLVTLELATVTAMRALGEAGNDLTDEAAPALASLVATTTTLRSLDLRRTRITSHGATMIVRALEANSSLAELAMRHGIAETILARIRSLLPRAAAAPRAGPPPHVAAIQSVYRSNLRPGA